MTTAYIPDYVSEQTLDDLAFYDAVDNAPSGCAMKVVTSRKDRDCAFRATEGIWCHEPIRPGTQYVRVTVFPHVAFVRPYCGDQRLILHSMGMTTRALCMDCGTRHKGIRP